MQSDTSDHDQQTGAMPSQPGETTVVSLSSQTTDTPKRRMGRTARRALRAGSASVAPVPGTPPSKRTPRPHKPVRTLGETEGPDPNVPIEDIRLAIGVIVGPHGVHGELKLELWTDAPDQLDQITQIWIGEEPRARRLANVRYHGTRALVQLTGVDTPELARTFTGQRVVISGSDARPLEANEFFIFQLIGLRAVTESGDDIGTVKDLMETGANDVLVIEQPGDAEDLLLPHHADYVLDVRPDDGIIVVRPIEYAN